MMKKAVYLMIAVVFLGLAVHGSAQALTVDATITADNHYGLYFGTPGSIQFVGRNEIGVSGNPGVYNWSQAETFSFAINPGDTIYIAAWSDDSAAQGWLGQFVLSSGGTVLSNTTDWEVYLTGRNLGDGSPAPTEAELQMQIAGATWQPVNFAMAHGSGPWGFISGISTAAQWIWGSDLIPGSGFGEYQIFRMTVPTSVPEPGTLLLLGGGLAGLYCSVRRRLQK